MPWFVLLDYTFSMTGVIIVTLVHTDGEMFVSHDYNYNHSVILKLNCVVFDWPACWNQFTVLVWISPSWSLKKQLEALQAFFLFSDHKWALCCWLVGACQADLYPGLSQAGGDDAHSTQRLMGGQHKRQEWALAFEVVHMEGNWYISLSPGPY